MTLYMNDKESIYQHLLEGIYRIQADLHAWDFDPKQAQFFGQQPVTVDSMIPTFNDLERKFQMKHYVVCFPINEAFTKSGMKSGQWADLLRIIAEQQYRYHNSVERKPVAVMMEDVQEESAAKLKAMQSVDWQEINRKVCDALLQAKASYIASYPAEFYDDQAHLFDAEMVATLGLTYSDLGKYVGWHDFITKNSIGSWQAFTNSISHAIFDMQLSAHMMTQAAIEPEKTGDAIVRVTYLNGDTIFQGTDTISSDMPADALGEIVATAMQTAWQKGDDPISATIILTFGKVQSWESK
ncbi:hypothetical protein EVC12_034 [Rhizobium phage RHph_I42]|nr:hypothetical protein EVC12_034 [Rhizobium phage RHph_I42]